MASIVVDLGDSIEWLKNHLDERYKSGTEEDILYLKAVIKYAWTMDGNMEEEEEEEKINGT